MNKTELAITGAGIIGLSAALELASAGAQVTVFERGRAMAEASSAAAGMLAAGIRRMRPGCEVWRSQVEGCIRNFLRMWSGCRANVCRFGQRGWFRADAKCRRAIPS